MKNFILIISGMLLLSLNTSFAQEWCPEGATWIYSGSAFSEKRYLKLEYEKDALIDEIEVKKIKRTISSEDHSFVPTHVSVYPDGFELMYNRNDTIFWYNNTEFVMLYDFNAEVGTKWEVKANPDINHPCEGKPDDDTLTVTEIGYSEIFGQDMLFYETMFSAWSFNGPIIRWVGSSAYPFPMPYIEKEPSCIPPDLFAGWPAYLMCYSDANIAGNCMLPTGITDEALKPKIMLYPNPTF